MDLCVLRQREAGVKMRCVSSAHATPSSLLSGRAGLQADDTKRLLGLKHCSIQRCRHGQAFNLASEGIRLYPQDLVRLTQFVP